MTKKTQHAEVTIVVRKTRYVKKETIIGMVGRKNNPTDFIPVVAIDGNMICTLQVFNYAEKPFRRVHRQWQSRKYYGRILPIPAQSML